MQVESNISRVMLMPEFVFSLNAQELEELCEEINRGYRLGDPPVEDAVYDNIILPRLAEIAPDSRFLHEVEPEPEEAFSKYTVEHASPMLSTDKAYSDEEVQRFVGRIRKSARTLGIAQQEVMIRVTAKLDGIAGNDSHGRLATRGNQLRGSDITHIFDRGVLVQGGQRSQGAGEVVVEELYYQDVLKPKYGIKHPRSFIAGLCGAETVKEYHQAATDAGVVRFVPYTTLPSLELSLEQFSVQWRTLAEEIRESSPYRTDGAIAEVIDQRIKDEMGATNRAHRWMIAIKKNAGYTETTVREITLQTGRTGRITPVMKVDPVVIDGVTNSSVTAHTAATLRDRGLGVGAKIGILRAGDVIPTLEVVLEPAEDVLEITACPCCGAAPEPEGNAYLVCPNTAGCSAQTVSRLKHWFNILGNVDGFGDKTIERLVAGGYSTIDAVYAMAQSDFKALGFGPQQSENLVAELQRSQQDPIPDWRFLAAFGIRHLGRGDSRKLLAAFPLEEIGGITAKDIESIPGFGPITSPAIAGGLSASWKHISSMIALGFNLEETPRWQSEGDDRSGLLPLAGESIVFTGTMEEGSRRDMEAAAAALGATVQSGVNAKTTILVAGKKAGSKMEKALANNAKAGKEVTQILNESQWIALRERIASEGGE